MYRTAFRLHDSIRLGLIVAIAFLLALSRTSIATANDDLVLICHGTGSDANEIVIIRVDSSGMNGHEIEELAATYDCKPAGGGSGGDAGGGGSGGSIDGGTSGTGGSGDGGGTGGPGDGTGSGGTSIAGGGSSGGSGGTSGGGTSAGGGSSGGSVRDADGEPGPHQLYSSRGARIVGTAGIGVGGASGAGTPQGLAFVAGGVRIVVPLTDTVARFLAHSTIGQQLGFGLTAISGVGFVLLILFGSLARRRRV